MHLFRRFQVPTANIVWNAQDFEEPGRTLMCSHLVALCDLVQVMVLGLTYFSAG